MGDSEFEESWDIDIPFQDANSENVDFKSIKNLPGEMHRTEVIGNKASSRVKGRMVEVVHGFQNDGMGVQATLVVFEWCLQAPPGSHRLENVEIHVVFQAEGRRWGMAPGESLSLYDPWPEAFFPKDPEVSLAAPVEVQRSGEAELALLLGHEPYVAFKARGKRDKSLFHQRIDYRSVTGEEYYYRKNHGKRNAVYWVIRENKALQSGVQYRVRTAVLLGRRAGDFGKFKATVFTWCNVWPLEKQMKRPLRAVGLIGTNDSIYFNPRVTPGQDPPPIGPTGDIDIAARPTMHDRDNLKTVVLSAYRLEDHDDAVAAKVTERIGSRTPADSATMPDEVAEPGEAADGNDEQPQDETRQ